MPQSHSTDSLLLMPQSHNTDNLLLMPQSHSTDSLLLMPLSHNTGNLLQFPGNPTIQVTYSNHLQPLGICGISCQVHVYIHIGIVKQTRFATIKTIA